MVELRIETKEKFQDKLLPLLLSGVRYFGGRELHEDGTPHYYVVFQFEGKVHWSDVLQKFSIEGDINAIRIEKPRPRQSPRGFIENTMAYCSKDGNTFGERLCLEGAASEQKKPMWQDVVDEQDEYKAWRLVRDRTALLHVELSSARTSDVCDEASENGCSGEAAAQRIISDP